MSSFTLSSSTSRASLTSFINPSSTTTSIEASESDSTGASFRFAHINEMITCEVALVEWQYDGIDVPMSFNITNVNVAQLSPSGNIPAPTSTVTPSAAKRDITISKRQYSGYGGTYLPQINEQIGTQLVPYLDNWQWFAPNVPQGWYQMLASVQGVLSATSSPFFVRNGTDVGCVLQFYPASSIPTPTSVLTITASTKPASATTQAPATTASSSKAISHTGAVAGGIAGTAAAVVLVILLIAFVRRRGRQDQKRRPKSIDSSFTSNARALTPSLLHHQSGPVGVSIVPLNPDQSSSPPATPVPVGLSSKELARLRSTHTTELTPASSSASDSLPTTTTSSSPPIVVTAEQGEVTPQTEPAIQSEVEYLRREVLRLHAQQVRAEVFQAPPSYGEG